MVEIAAFLRVRWKIENESLNVLKNNGYNLAHNFGHGKKNLVRIFAAMNLLAFAFHTACDCLETLLATSPRGHREAITILPRTPHHLRLRRLPQMDQTHD